MSIGRLGTNHYGSVMRWRHLAGPFLVVCISVGAADMAQHPTVAAVTPRLLGTVKAKVDTVSVGVAHNWGPGQVARITRLGQSLGSEVYRVAYPTFSMTRITRRVADVETDVQRIPETWFIPMGATVYPVEMVRTLAGSDAADVLAAGKVLMDERSAKMRGADVGDVIYLQSVDRDDVRFEIGGFTRKWLSDSSDIVVSDAMARRLGFDDFKRLMFVGGDKIGSAVVRLRSSGFVNGNTYRIRTSWGPENPDATDGIVSMKLELGEFYFRPRGRGAIDIQYAWRLRNIAWNKLYASIPIATSCHVKIVASLQGALTEIKRAGLESEINVADSNRYGGCYSSRTNRLSSSFPAISRHAWAAAIDLNITMNPQGGIPRMNCDVVRIFRKWGFAWGGNFTPFDGMHFEWVGEPRHKLEYPSMRCPNKVTAPTTTTTTIAEPAPSTTTSVPETSTTVAQ